MKVKKWKYKIIRNQEMKTDYWQWNQMTDSFSGDSVNIQTRKSTREEIPFMNRESKKMTRLLNGWNVGWDQRVANVKAKEHSSFISSLRSLFLRFQSSLLSWHFPLALIWPALAHVSIIGSQGMKTVTGSECQESLWRILD